MIRQNVYVAVLNQLKMLVSQELSRCRNRKSFYYKHDLWWWLGMIDLSLSDFSKLTSQEKNQLKQYLVEKIIVKDYYKLED